MMYLRYFDKLSLLTVIILQWKFAKNINIIVGICVIPALNNNN